MTAPWFVYIYIYILVGLAELRKTSLGFADEALEGSPRRIEELVLLLVCLDFCGSEDRS